MVCSACPGPEASKNCLLRVHQRMTPRYPFPHPHFGGTDHPGSKSEARASLMPRAQPYSRQRQSEDPHQWRFIVTSGTKTWHRRANGPHFLSRGAPGNKQENSVRKQEGSHRPSPAPLSPQLNQHTQPNCSWSFPQGSLGHLR